MGRKKNAAPEYVADGVALAYRAPSPLQPIRQPEDVVHACRMLKLETEQREHFVALLLNARHECMAIEIISVGSLNASIVHPREVFLPAIQLSAASFVVVHNHPSGDPEPSDEDMSITLRLKEVGRLLGIELLDHVIIASRGIVSFRAKGVL